MILISTVWRIFGIFRIFKGTFIALTGDTEGVARCHWLRLDTRYDKNIKNENFLNVYFFDEKYFSENVEKSKIFKKSLFFAEPLI